MFFDLCQADFYLSNGQSKYTHIEESSYGSIQIGWVPDIKPTGS